MYTALGVKTDYSLLKSLITIDDLISYAIKNNLHTLGILDNNLNSSYAFYKKCLLNNIKPIIGLDINIDNNNRLFLYPKNYHGLTILFKILKYKIDNNITINNLSNYNSDIICVLPYESINIYNNINKIFDITFLSYKNNIEYKEEINITNNTIYINDIYALDKESSKYINYLYMIDNNLKLGEYQLINYENNILDIKDYDTSKLTNLINISFPSNQRYIPIYDNNINSKEYLSELTHKGLAKRLNNNISDEYKNRLEYELKVINDMGFTDYFLIVFDYVRYAVKNSIMVGAGRGSAVGSLVAYSLGITWIDPLKYDLIFERFLNPERVTMPDIDIDFDASKRDQVVAYVQNRYGIDKVAHIITYNNMQAREVLRLIAKINNISDNNLDILLKYIDAKKSLKDNLTDEVKSILKEYSNLNKVYHEAIYLEGLKKNIGTHAAGIVICSKELTDLVPVCKSGSDYLTCYDKDELEELGLLKMDFLSIKNLTIMQDILDDIYKISGKKLNINKVPLEDSLVYDLFSKANTTGIFQFESAGMKNFLKKLKPNNFYDLIIAIAIFRPGASDNLDTFVNRHNGNEEIAYPLAELEPILKSTYGILIYQEQVMQILVKMAGYTFGEADIIRRAISKKKMNIIVSEKDNFIKRSVNNGYSEADATNIYDLIVKFGDYGFNKSHSVAYAFIAYQMAYLKVHFKEIFYINVLNNNFGSDEKTKEYINEAKSLGVKFLKPDINLSSDKYILENNSIRLPFRVIKGISSIVANNIINVRGNNNFKDFYDFCIRMNKYNLSKQVYDALIDADVFSSFSYNKNTLKYNLDNILTYADLASNLDESLVSIPEMQIVKEEDNNNIQNEIKLFGFYISDHPCAKYPNCFKLRNIEDNFDKYIDTYDFIENIKTLKTKKGDDMAFITASDETGKGDFVVFPKIVNQIFDIKTGDIVHIKGHVERRYDRYQIIVNEIKKV